MESLEELRGRRDALSARFRQLRAEEPRDGCGLKEYLTWCGRWSEVEVEIRDIDRRIAEARE